MLTMSAWETHHVLFAHRALHPFSRAFPTNHSCYWRIILVTSHKGTWCIPHLWRLEGLLDIPLDSFVYLSYSNWATNILRESQQSIKAFHHHSRNASEPASSLGDWSWRIITQATEELNHGSPGRVKTCPQNSKSRHNWWHLCLQVTWSDLFPSEIAVAASLHTWLSVEIWHNRHERCRLVQPSTAHVTPSTVCDDKNQ